MMLLDLGWSNHTYAFCYRIILRWLNQICLCPKYSFVLILADIVNMISKITQANKIHVCCFRIWDRIITTNEDLGVWLLSILTDAHVPWRYWFVLFLGPPQTYIFVSYNDHATQEMRKCSIATDIDKIMFFLYILCPNLMSILISCYHGIAVVPNNFA